MYSLFKPKFYNIPFGNLKGNKVFLSPSAGFNRIWGFYNPKVIKFIKYYLEKGSTCLVFSSDFGYISLICAKIVGSDGKVINIDPSETSRNYFFKTLEKDEIKNVQVLPALKNIKSADFVVAAYSSEFEKFLKSSINMGPILVIKVNDQNNFKKVYRTLTSFGYLLYDLEKDLLGSTRRVSKDLYIVARKYD